MKNFMHWLLFLLWLSLLIVVMATRSAALMRLTLPLLFLVGFLYLGLVTVLTTTKEGNDNDK